MDFQHGRIWAAEHLSGFQAPIQSKYCRHSSPASRRDLQFSHGVWVDLTRLNIYSMMKFNGHFCYSKTDRRTTTDSEQEEAAPIHFKPSAHGRE